MAVAASATALQGLGRMAPWRQGMMLAALAGSVALGVSVAMWSNSPNHALLYSSLGAKEASEVLDALERAGIPFRVSAESGAVTVPASKVHEARIKLAEDGLPKGTTRGFDMLEKGAGFGQSEFMERARYGHALELELAQTIASLNQVQSARVHLALPRQSAFVRNRRAPSASVLVNLHPGRALEDGQPDAIAHLVAAAIPNLESSQVRVVDERGRLLTRPGSSSRESANGEELDYAKRLEERYVRRIEDILAPVVGVDGVRAQVAAELDFSYTEQARETYNPDLPALRSEQVVEENRASGGAAGGVPGALSNQPPAPAEVPEVAGDPTLTGAGAAGTNGASGRRQATRNYELDRTVERVHRPAGAVRRVSAAVVIDDVRIAGADGRGTDTRPRTPEEIERITGLVKEAIGFDVERGDTVNVINAPFASPPPAEPLPATPIWEQAWVWDAARQGGGVLLVLFLAFGVLRPLMRTLVNRELAEREMEQAAERARLTALAEPAVDIQPDVAKLRADNSTDIEIVRTIVQEDPKRVANVMRGWVAEDE